MALFVSGFAAMFLAAALPARAVTAVPTPANVGFASATVGTLTPQSQTVSFAVSGYSTSFTPTAAMHYGHDYSVGTANCTTTSGTTETCTFKVTFQPTLPGMRKDALIVSDGATVLSTVLVYGIGNAPQAAMNPGVKTQVTFPQYAYGSTVDENGTAYVLDAIGDSVYSYTKAGVLTELPITGLASPHGIAIDGAGTLYIANNTYSFQLVTYNTISGAQGAITIDPPAPYVPCQNSNDGNLEYLYSVAVDGPGNIFVLEILCGQIFELKTNGTYATTTINPAMTQPSFLAVDDADDVFLSGYAINELTAAGAQSQINSTGADEGIAVDASGILYATRYSISGNDVYDYGVAELQPANYETPTIGLEPGNEDVPLGLGLGSDGTMFVGDYTNLDIVNRNEGAIAFGEQTSGTPSTAQVVQIVNIGNQPLTVSDIALVDAPGYTIQATGTLDCSNGIVLAPSDYCQAGVVLTPTHAGNWNGSLVFTSNSLNDSGTQQTVTLTGFVNGVYVTANPTAIAFAPHAVGSSSSAHAVTLTNNGLAYSAGIGTPTSTNSVFTPNIDTCTAGIAPGGSCQITVTFTPNAAGNFNGVISAAVSSSGGGPAQSVNINASGTGEAANTTTTALTSSVNPSVSGQSVTFSATVTASSGPTPTGTVTFKHGGTVIGTQPLSGGVATVAYSALTVGSHSMTATYNGSSSDQVSTSPVITQTVLNATTTSLTSSVNPSTSGESVTFTAKVTASSGPTPTGTVTFKHGGTVIGMGNLSGGVATLAYSALTVGSHSITATYNGSSSDGSSTSAAISQVVNP